MARNGKRLGFLPNWRIFSYVILVFNLIMLIWTISAGASGSGTPDNCDGLSAQTCNDAQNAGAGIAVVLLIVIWAIVDVILGVLWLVTNHSKARPCPHCGRDVKKGQFQCKGCGFDFRSAMQPPPGYYPPQPPVGYQPPMPQGAQPGYGYPPPATSAPYPTQTGQPPVAPTQP